MLLGKRHFLMAAKVLIIVEEQHIIFGHTVQTRTVEDSTFHVSLVMISLTTR